MAKSREKGEKTKLQDEKNRDFSPNSGSHSPLAFDFCFLTCFFITSPVTLSFICEYTASTCPFPSIHASSLPFGFFFKAFSSPPPCLYLIFQVSSFFFSCLKNVFPWLLIPPSCSSILSRAPPLSLSFTVFLSVLLLLLFIVGYRRSLCLSLKDYLCSHLDEGFGKGSPSASSFRGPMHGRLAHKGGRVCVSIRVSHVCLCVCACVC